MSGLLDELSTGQPSFPEHPSLSAQTVLIQGSIQNELVEKFLHVTPHQHVPILVQENLVDGHCWESRLRLAQRGPALQCRFLTAPLTAPALLPALCIPPQQQPQQARTYCFWKYIYLYAITKIIIIL